MRDEGCAKHMAETQLQLGCHRRVCYPQLHWHTWSVAAAMATAEEIHAASQQLYVLQNDRPQDAAASANPKYDRAPSASLVNRRHLGEQAWVLRPLLLPGAGPVLPQTGQLKAEVRLSTLLLFYRILVSGCLAPLLPAAQAVDASEAPDRVQAPLFGGLALVDWGIVQALPHGLAHLELLVLVVVAGCQPLRRHAGIRIQGSGFWV